MKRLVLLLLVSCTRNSSDIGKIVSEYDWECVKSGTDLGISMSGDLVVTDSCRVSKCFKRTTQLGETFFKDKLLNKEIVDDKFCL